MSSAVRVVIGVVVLAVSLSGCKVMQRISEGAYRNAVSDGVVDDLKDRGIALRGRPDCTSPKHDTQSVVRVTCTARTKSGEPVAVHGVAYDADTDRPRETYVVTVAGREVLRKDCLGIGCHSLQGHGSQGHGS